jgi:hypothetical protein
VSIVLHMRAMREIGTARQAALFATAPFAGARVGVRTCRTRITGTATERIRHGT